jgi:hypothetical protein
VQVRRPSVLLRAALGREFSKEDLDVVTVELSPPVWPKRKLQGKIAGVKRGEGVTRGAAAQDGEQDVDGKERSAEGGGAGTSGTMKREGSRDGSTKGSGKDSLEGGTEDGAVNANGRLQRKKSAKHVAREKREKTLTRGSSSKHSSSTSSRQGNSNSSPRRHSRKQDGSGGGSSSSGGSRPTIERSGENSIEAGEKNGGEAGGRGEEGKWGGERGGEKAGAPRRFSLALQGIMADQHRLMGDGSITSISSEQQPPLAASLTAGQSALSYDSSTLSYDSTHTVSSPHITDDNTLDTLARFAGGGNGLARKASSEAMEEWKDEMRGLQQDERRGAGAMQVNTATVRAGAVALGPTVVGSSSSSSSSSSSIVDGSGAGSGARSGATSATSGAAGAAGAAVRCEDIAAPEPPNVQQHWREGASTLPPTRDLFNRFWALKPPAVPGRR